MKVTNISRMKAYELTDEVKVPVIKNRLGMEGLQLIKTYMNEENENA